MRAWKLFFRFIEYGFLKPRNGFIIGGVIIGFAFLGSTNQGIYPKTIGTLLLFFSILYYFIFEKPKEQMFENGLNEFEQIRVLLKERNDNLTPIILNILNILQTFKTNHQGRFSIISNYMVDIIEFERIIPELVRSYRQSFDYIDENDHRINAQIAELQRRFNSTTNEITKETYKNALLEKELAILEVKKIKESMEQTESNMYFILSALEKVDAMIKSSEFASSNVLKDSHQMNEHFEAFSQSIKDISKNINF